MRKPRRYIISDRDIAHVFWRCHNSSHLLKRRDIKDFVLAMYFQYADRYGIGIIDFNIMDNHAHFSLRASSAKNLGDFARVVHSRIAQFVNKILGQDSQVIRERYKSPVVRDQGYLTRLTGYIWLNRVAVDPKNDPSTDKYCSAYHRIKGTELGKKLLSYSEIGLCEVGGELRFARKLLISVLEEFKNKTFKYTEAVFEHLHTIGAASVVSSFSKLLRERLLERATGDPPAL